MLSHFINFSFLFILYGDSVILYQDFDSVYHIIVFLQGQLQQSLKFNSSLLACFFYAYLKFIHYSDTDQEKLI